MSQEYQPCSFCIGLLQFQRLNSQDGLTPDDKRLYEMHLEEQHYWRSDRYLKVFGR